MPADVPELPAPPPPDTAEAVFPPPVDPYAGWWRRVGGAVIDAMIVGVSTNFALIALAATGSVVVIAAGFVLVVGGWVAYHVVLNANGQQTIGRRVLATRVVQENGDDLGYGLSALRLLATPLSWALLGLGLLWPLWDDRRQTFHDKVAATTVIRA